MFSRLLGVKAVTLQYCMTETAGPALQPLCLVEEITHRVLNEYAEAIASLFLAARAASDPQSALTLRSAARRLQAHAEAHRALQAPIDEGLADLGDYIARLCASLSNAQLAANGVRLMVSADAVWLNIDRCWRVGLIVAELIRNAARHGFSGGAGAIWVEICEGSGHVSCRVRNDGCGKPTPAVGRGRRLVQALAADLGGSVDWRFTSGGCCVHLKFDRHDDGVWITQPRPFEETRP